MMQWILGSCLLILTILAVRQLFRKRLDPVLVYALWIAVALRLLVPGMLFQSEIVWLPTVALPERSDALVTTHFANYEDAKQFALLEHSEVVTHQGENSTQSYSVQTAPPAALQWEDLLRSVWLTGGIAVGLILLGSNVRFTRQLCRSRRRVDSIGTLPVYVTQAVPAPCLCPFPHPAIYVTPEVLADDEQMRYVLLHEQTHWRHGDLLWSLIRCGCLAVHWWNPLVWWAVRASREDMELACDAAVIRTMDAADRLAYGRMLIQMSIPHPHQTERLACTTALSGSGRTLKARVRMIAQKPEMKRVTVIVALTVTVTALVIGFTGCATPPAANTDVLTIHGTTVRFVLPDGLEAEVGDQYQDEILSYYFAPMAYTVDETCSNTPITWVASGGIEEYNSDCLVWDGDTIQTGTLMMNHTWIEEDLGPIKDTQVPSYLLRVGHDLYTAAGLGFLMENGHDLSELELSSEYWTILFAHPEDETMLVFSLCTKDFTMDDAVALSHSVQY